MAFLMDFPDIRTYQGPRASSEDAETNSGSCQVDAYVVLGYEIRLPSGLCATSGIADL